MIKKKNSIYSSGRKKGIWWKYKVDPMQLDAVLIYAKGVAVEELVSIQIIVLHYGKTKN